MFGLVGLNALLSIGLSVGMVIYHLTSGSLNAWYELLTIAQLVLSAAIILTTITACLLDVNRRQRDWIHWLGAILYVLNVGSGIFWSIAFRSMWIVSWFEA